MRERLEEALRAGDAEYIDIRIEDVVSTRIEFQGASLDEIGSSRKLGGIVRALVKGGWGYSTFNDLSRLGDRVKEACESARLVGSGRSAFAPVEPVVDETKAALEKDFREIPLAQKKAVIEAYNRLALGYHPKIQTTASIYGDTFKRIWFASSEGTYIADEQPDSFVSVAVTGRDGDNVQSGFEALNSDSGFQAVENFHAQTKAAAQRAVDLLSAPPVTGGKYTVVLNPQLAGVLIHEAFGHLSESDFVYENDRLQDLMRLGKRFGPDMLNVIDDGAHPGGEGTHKYDFEGVKTRKNYLIKDGILVGRLHSRETAAKMGEAVTGNARSVGFQYPPIVRMTNTYIDHGSAAFEDLIRDVKLGVYACNAFGGETALEMFTFSAAYGYMIRDGQIAEMVRDVVLTGNVFETLLNIDGLGAQVEWNRGSGRGGCGKGEQFPLRVGMGGPHVRVQNVVVGGKA
jgi:TldD protein